MLRAAAVGLALARPALAPVRLPPASLAPLPAASLAAPSLSPSLPAAALPALAAAPAPALESAGHALVEAGGRSFRFVLRSGRGPHGREVLTLDALDAADPGRGTVGHADFAVSGENASADGPLDMYVGRSALPAELLPAEADLSHWREQLWFGFAVRREYRGAGLGGRLLDEMEALLRARGVKRLFIRATESSVSYYRARYGARLVHEEEEKGREGETYYGLEIEL